LPDPAVLFFGMTVSSIGLALFVYGKKQARMPQLAVGLALMATPYFATSLRPMGGLTVTLLAMLWWALRAGW
jgi:hypothetical protein